MAMAKTPEMAEAMDDLRDSEKHAQGLDEGTETQVALDWEEFEKKLCSALDNERHVAEAVAEPIHRKWAQWYRMLYQNGLWDDPNDPLTRRRFYWPLVARLKDQAVAILFNRIFPNRSVTDFFRFKAMAEGLSRVANLCTSMMKQKFRTMRPDDGASFHTIMLELMNDWYAVGNIFAIPTHRGALVGDGVVDETRSGPQAQYIAPLNVYPMRSDVNSIDQTDVFLYQPLEDWDLEDMDPEVARRMRAEVGKASVRRVDKSGHEAAGGFDDENVSAEKSLFESWVKLGRFPVYELAKVMSEDLEETVDIAAKTREWVEIAQARFGFPMQDVVDDMGSLIQPGAYDLNGKLRRWWLIRYSDGVIQQCEPYPLLTPNDANPLMHLKMIHKNNHLMGDGLYDRGHVDERFQNRMLKNLMHIVSLQCNPPYIVRQHLIDPKQWQMWDGDPALEPNMPIYASMDPSSPNIAPFETINWQANVIPLLDGQIERAGDRGREYTGISSSLEGQDNSDTATQNANNVAFSMALVEMYEGAWTTFLEDLVSRCFMIQWQSMKIGGLSSMVPHTDEEVDLQLVVMSHDHLPAMDLLEVQIITASSPMNRQQQLGAVERYIQLWGGVPTTNVAELQKDHTRLLGGDTDRWMLPGVAGDIQTMLRNAAMFGGPGAAMMLMQSINPMAGGGMMGAPANNSVGGMEGQGSAQQGPPRLGGARPGGDGSSRVPAMMEGRQKMPTMQPSGNGGAEKMNGG